MAAPRQALPTGVRHRGSIAVKLGGTKHCREPKTSKHEVSIKKSKKILTRANLSLRPGRSCRREGRGDASKFISTLGLVTADVAVQALLNQQIELDKVVDDTSHLDETLANSTALIELSRPQQMTLPFEIAP